MIAGYPPPRREPSHPCAFCARPITEKNDFRFVVVDGQPARAHKYCAAPGERPRG